ncbi:MAG: hypothetical protein CSA26_03400 [Desulfobacterales bacterium]|nr:MAG: hypothetical protein CSA26_03400 [Desulfobacterales bacterium]
MRCPKCGYISFDNIETCLKCNKPITAGAFSGSTYNVEAPSFLKFTTSQTPDDFEGDTGMDGEIEFEDPDLELLIDDDDEPDFRLDDENTDDDDRALSETFAEDEAFGDDEEDEPSLTADLGQFEDVQEDEEIFRFDDEDDNDEPEANVIDENEPEAIDERSDTETEAAADTEEPVAGTSPLDIPDELTDISDLSPPERTQDTVSFPPERETAGNPLAEETTESERAAAEPEDDLDFSSLDMDLDLEREEPVAPSSESISEMDDDLDFDLDLGGLSIHNDLK